VYGTPEMFVVDKKGVIRHKLLGPVDQDIWLNEILPLIQKLEAEA
jgi:cytochrome c biogenesis protein CcmG, thiol:disulfide interchange protein DsbE